MNTKRQLLIGAVRPFSDASYLKSLGYDFLEGRVAEILMPEVPDEVFDEQIKKLKASPLPIRSCCGFIPAKFKITGPKVDHVGALAYAEVALQRAEKIGIPYIVFGSGDARSCPNDFQKKEAIRQFISFCKDIVELLKSQNLHVTILIEPLQKQETNIINSLADGAEIVRAVNNDHLKLLADFYHMIYEGEDESSILKYGDLIQHCHIAEKKGRFAPGTANEDFTAFFKALEKVGYAGGISCKCLWHDFEEDAKKAISALKKF